jgi:hypothetical protein
MVQDIEVPDRAPVKALWDGGSQVSLITHEAARARKLANQRSNLHLKGIGESSCSSNLIYEVPLRNVEGKTTYLKAYGVDVLTSPVESFDPSDVLKKFVNNPKTIKKEEGGDIDLLIGLDRLDLAPVPWETRGCLTLFKSRFGSGWFVAGKVECQSSKTEREATVLLCADAYDPGELEVTPAGSQGKESCFCQTAVCLSVRRGLFAPADFLSAEAMGTEMPRRCATCKNCKECQFRMDSLTFKENKEYEIILDNLKYDKEKKKFIASYPFCVSPSVLGDNFRQAKGIMFKQEQRLVKQKRLDEFNEQFHDAVNRGVFRELKEEELSDWDGPVNYISMVEAFKSGPSVTTPLRICMNSSLKQPPPVSMSLNDCLVKGPSALADLFTVTLSMREYRYALTKDLSKFYQCVAADELAQNLRRIVWRLG